VTFYLGFSQHFFSLRITLDVQNQAYFSVRQGKIVGEKIPDLPDPNTLLYNNKAILIYNYVLILTDLRYS
jgi:hypothetical protein